MNQYSPQALSYIMFLVGFTQQSSSDTNSPLTASENHSRKQSTHINIIQLF